MKLLFPLLLVMGFNSFGQMQVKCDSIIEKHGQWAKLRGKEVNSDTSVYFCYSWIGMGKPSLIGQFFYIFKTLYGRRKTLVTKLEYDGDRNVIFDNH